MPYNTVYAIHWGWKNGESAKTAYIVYYAGIFCTASLGVFGDQAFQEGELTPEPTGQEGRLEWAFLVAIGGASFAVLTSLLFYGDAVRIAIKNRSCR